MQKEAAILQGRRKEREGCRALIISAPDMPHGGEKKWKEKAKHSHHMMLACDSGTAGCEGPGAAGTARMVVASLASSLSVPPMRFRCLIVSAQGMGKRSTCAHSALSL